jgi:hypothetical protein
MAGKNYEFESRLCWYIILAFDFHTTPWFCVDVGQIYTYHNGHLDLFLFNCIFDTSAKRFALSHDKRKI